MTHDNTFINELRTSFANLTNLINGRVTALDRDIEENIETIQVAYDNIKADKTELREIAVCAYEFATAMIDTHEESEAFAAEGDCVIEDMYDLVEDNYLVDPDYKLVEEDGEEVERDEEYADDYKA